MLCAHGGVDFIHSSGTWVNVMEETTEKRNDSCCAHLPNVGRRASRVTRITQLTTMRLSVAHGTSPNGLSVQPRFDGAQLRKAAYVRK
jgi:hypothetical protein